MKKIISWVLVAAIMLGFVGMIAFSVFAASIVDRVYITTPEFWAGDAITTEFELEINGGTLVENKGWYDVNMQPASGAFVKNEIYYLRLEIAAPEGFVYSENDTVVYPNGYGVYYMSVNGQDESRMLLDIEFNFNPIQVQMVSLKEMPEIIKPGPATVPETMYASGNVTISLARWVDKNKQPVTELEDGKAYYLEVTLVPQEGYEFRNWVDIYGYGGRPYTDQIISANEAKAWFRYSMEPGVGDIRIDVQGLEVGKPIDGLQIKLSDAERVELRAYYVVDVETGETVNTGNFESGKLYNITYVIAPQEGYNIEEHSVVEITDVHSWGGNVWNGLLQVYHDFDAREKVDSLELISTGAEIGAPISGVALQINSEFVTLDQICVYDHMTDELLTEGVFEEGRLYRIVYQMDWKSGYGPSEEFVAQLNGEIAGYISMDTWINVTQMLTSLEEVPYLAVWLPSPQEGYPADSAMIMLEDNDYTVTGTWYDMATDEEAKVFESDHSYRLEVTITPPEGKQITENTKIEFVEEGSGDVQWGVSGDGRSLQITTWCSFWKERIDYVEIGNVPEQVQPGAVEQVELYVESGAVEITDCRWVDTEGNAVTSLQENEIYYLEITLVPAEGEQFSEELEVCGYGQWNTQVINDYQAKAWLRYSLQPGVGDLMLTLTGAEIGLPISGLQLILQEDAKVEWDGSFVVEDLRTHEPVTGTFASGERYGIWFSLTASEGYDIYKVRDICVNDQWSKYWLEEEILYIYYEFSGCKPVGDVYIKPSGVEIGKPISGVTAELLPNTTLTLREIEVFNYFTGEPVLDGVFQEGTTYTIRYHMDVNAGYNPYDGMELTLDGVMDGYSYDDDFVTLDQLFNTSEPLDTIELLVTEPKVGEKVENAIVTVADENCVVDYRWIDEITQSDAQGVFEAGHSYVLYVDLQPVEGKTFQENTRIQLPAGTIQYGSFNEDGMYGYVSLRWSFLEQIDKVELAAIPETLSVGDTLPTDLMIEENANYTIMAEWGKFSEDGNEGAERVDGNGAYGLYVSIHADPGYEFADDLEVTVGGKKFPGCVLDYDTEVVLYRCINLGVQEIKRIDFTVEEPQVGGVPGKVTCTTAGVGAVEAQWTSSWENNTNMSWITKEFQEDAYNFLMVVAFAQDGYAFADDAQLYVNGRKVDIAMDARLGYVSQTEFAFGKISEGDAPGTGDEGDVAGGTAGDVDGVAGVNVDDAIYLLQHVLMPELFQVAQNADFDGNGHLDVDDAIYLLQHVLMPDLFPLESATPSNVMTYAQYMEAELDTQVTVACYVQDTQSWWNDSICVYAQDRDGGYFIYEMACSEADAAKLTPGTKILVTGYKSNWAGLVEIVEATFEFVEGADSFVAEPLDVTKLLGSDELLPYQNQKVLFKGVTVVACNDKGDGFQYGWDGSKDVGSDIYFKVAANGKEATFCLEQYLTEDGTLPYDTAETLQVGDVIDIECFLYWYEGPEPHVIGITKIG